jgi:C4-dicarboxylate-specific signal transduction histidine kinase
MAERAHHEHGFTVRVVNDQAVALLGHTREAWCGATEFWIAITHPEDRPRALHQLRGVLRSRTDAPALVRWRRADGTDLPMEVHLCKVADAAGETMALRGFALPESRSSRLQEELERARERIVCLSRRATLNALVTSLVHEINQPLNAIQNNAEAARMLVGNGSAAPEIAGMLDEIIAANERADDVLRRARGLVAHVHSVVSTFDVKAVVADVCELLASDALLRNASLVAKVPAGPCRVAGDRVQFLQVLLNLAGNALDAVSRTPLHVRSVDVAVVAPEGEWIAICVVDSGSGIEPAMLPRVFEPHVSTKRDGLGLGLDIASSIVEAHGGYVWAGNNREAGAHFVVALPRADDGLCL